MIKMCKYNISKTIVHIPIKKMNLGGSFPKLDVIIEEYELDQPNKRKMADEQTMNDNKKIKFV